MLVICIAKHGRTDALRATKILNALDTNILGVVVNGKDDARSNYGRSYGYGGYGYVGDRSTGYHYGGDGSEDLEADGEEGAESIDAQNAADLLSLGVANHRPGGDESRASRNGDSTVTSNSHVTPRQIG